MKSTTTTDGKKQILDRIRAELEAYATTPVREKPQPICDLATAKKVVEEAIRAQAKRQGFTLKMTPALKSLVPALAAYCSNRAGELNLHKGLFLWGPCGSGKTFLMRSLHLALEVLRNRQRSFKMVSVPYLYNELMENGKIYLSDLYQDHRCFDDLGFHTTAIRSFGNRINPIEMILTHRYQHFIHRGTLTHITSNLPLEQTGQGTALDQILDERIISRLKEMMNFVLLNEKDFRG